MHGGFTAEIRFGVMEIPGTKVTEMAGAVTVMIREFCRGFAPLDAK